MKYPGIVDVMSEQVKMPAGIFYAAKSSHLLSQDISSLVSFVLSTSFLEREYIKFGGFCFEFQCIFLDSVGV